MFTGNSMGDQRSINKNFKASSKSCTDCKIAVEISYEINLITVFGQKNMTIY